MPLRLFAPTSEDRPLIAIGLLLIATFTLALQDTLMKLMTTETSFWQIQTLRSAGNILISVSLAVVSSAVVSGKHISANYLSGRALAGGLALLTPVNRQGVFLRSAFLAVTMFLFFSGAPFLSVTEMAAGLYTYPIFVSLLAGPVLGESIGPWRIGSMLIGTAGALIVISPWREGFNAVQLLPVSAGFFFACNLLTLRRACRYESTLALSFVAGVVFLLVGLTGVLLLSILQLPESVTSTMPYVAIGWPQVTWLVAGFAILASVLNLTGNICMTRAYQTADASLLAPLDFVYLIFAAIWGRVFFNDWPETHTTTGMLLIVCAGVTIAVREHRNNAL